MKKFIISGIVSALLLLLIVSPGFAKSVKKNIEVTYNNIQIVIDGVKITPKDANGNIVEPFIYNGTTYLPVRAVGEAIGKKVEWDAATQTVYLGEKTTATEKVYSSEGSNAPPPHGTSVWRANGSSEFYHSTNTCSGMLSPHNLLIEDALVIPLKPCSKCWSGI